MQNQTSEVHPIQFEVNYGWREYLSVTREHALPYINEDRRQKGKQDFAADNWMLRAMHGVFTTPIYWFKIINVGKCSFSIDGEQITRQTKGGVLRCAWRDVTEVKRYSHAYLVMKHDGAMPLPYRCFTPAQRTKFDELLSRFGK